MFHLIGAHTISINLLIKNHVIDQDCVQIKEYIKCNIEKNGYAEPEGNFGSTNSPQKKFNKHLQNSPILKKALHACMQLGCF